MNYSEYKNYLSSNLLGTDSLNFKREEEYFFVLGQLIVYSFIKLGGIHKLRNEFNYLTNPYLPQKIQALAKRNLLFLTKFEKVSSFEQRAYVLYKALMENREKYLDKYVNEASCTDAFYEGLHTTNILL